MRYMKLPWLLLLMMTAMHRTRGQVSVNRAPQFLPNGDMARFALREDTPAGSAVYKLQGADPEGAPLLYAISGEHFTVDKTTGVVTLARELDRETTDFVTVVISITDESVGDSGPNTISLLREIPVLDINDNAPIFVGRPYSVQLFENTPVGTKVFENVTVTDKDGGINGDVILTCFPLGDAVCSTFDVTAEKISDGKYQGIITLRKALDFEQQRSYSLTLRATDRAKEPGRRLTATANVVIEIHDIQDQPPVFLHSPYSATADENTPQGISILRVGAQDGDFGDPRPVRLDIVNDTLGYFQLVPVSTTGDDDLTASYDVVTSDVPMDRENPLVLDSGGIYSFQLRATELINGEIPAEYKDTAVTIVITDTDDQIPVFNEPIFHVNISEQIGVGSPLPGLNLMVTDGDIGDNARYSLSLRDVWQSRGVVSLHPHVGQGHTILVLRVNDTSSLDYDTQDNHTVVFDVVAGLSNSFGVVREVASSRVYLHVQDDNDHVPEFSQATVHLTVAETEPAGALVAPLAATDADSGNFGLVRYTLKGHDAHKFSTHPFNGGIYVGDKSLDYEAQRSYTLSLVATDGGNRSSSASVHIDVLDVNDNAPQFDLKEFSRTVRIKSTAFQPEFFIIAKDVDGPQQGGGRIRYEVVDRNFEGNIIDVEEDTGEVVIRSEVSPEHTPKGQYELKVRAWDFGNPPKSADTRVNVRVGYQGNQRPYFRGNAHLPNGVAYYNVSVKEAAGSGTQVHQLEAVDPDGATAQLSYILTENGKDNFVVEEATGILKTSSFVDLDLERNPKMYQLKVEVVDQGFPVSETGTVTVIVNVEDVNNKSPVFDKDSYTFYVTDDAEENATIGTIEATDADQNPHITYFLKNNVTYYDKAGLVIDDDVVFTINEKGSIILKRQISPLVHRAIFQVAAEDLNAEANRQISLSYVEVFVQSRNVVNPFFIDSTWTTKNKTIIVNFDEELPANSVIFTLKAKDPLQKGSLEYQILRNDFPDVFRLDMNGELAILKKLDYEAESRKQWKLAVRVVVVENLPFEVSRKNGEQVLDLQQLPSVRFADTQVLINLQNINDFAPTFSQESYRKRVMESIKPSEVILQVIATDSDQDNVIYSLTSGDSASFFTINSTTGQISLGRGISLDREKQAVYRMDVIATDSPARGLPKQAHAQVWIEALDVNDNPPSFSQMSYSAVIPENVPPGTRILSVHATDPDLGLASEIVYTVVDDGETVGLFTVDPSTGDVKTNRVLTGRGRSDPYTIAVKAADKGDQVLDPEGRHSQLSHSTEVPVTIYIGDVVVNDGVPVFIRPELGQHANVSEDAPPNTPVLQVIATDPDDPNSPEGQIRFKILRDGKQDSLPFRINPETGIITTKSNLDREKTAAYFIIIVAYDLGSIPQEATRLVQVDILDVDDHLPRFDRGVNDAPLAFAVTEESEIGTEVGLVQCSDPDSLENALIDYVISDGNPDEAFSIERTPDNVGVIRVLGRIDREMAAAHTIAIKCFKMAPNGKKLNYLRPYDPKDMSERQVLITVQDIDDNSPAFPATNITLGVRLNAPVGTVLATFHAIDPDADSPPLHYSIDQVKFHPFRSKGSATTPTDVLTIEGSTGELRSTAPMRMYSDGHFEILVKANNSAFSGRSANITAKLFVLREKNLLKFVFDKTPREVQPMLHMVEETIANALNVPKVNIYDTQYLTQDDGSLDFSSTSSCFQVIGNSSFTPDAAERLLNISSNGALRAAYVQYGIRGVGKCASAAALKETNWAQLTVLILAAIIGVIALIAAFSLCCCYARYKRQVQKRIEARRQVPTVVPAPEYMSVRPPTTYTASLMGSQLMLNKPPRSARGSQLTLNKGGGSMLMNQHATQMGSQLIINAGKNQPIILGSQMLTTRSGLSEAREDFGSQIMYEYVQEGADNLAYEDT